jgi:hypothetical protein
MEKGRDIAAFQRFETDFKNQPLYIVSEPNQLVAIFAAVPSLIVSSSAF